MLFEIVIGIWAYHYKLHSFNITTAFVFGFHCVVRSLQQNAGRALLVVLGERKANIQVDSYIWELLLEFPQIMM
jgi:hypothetical protein